MHPRPGRLAPTLTALALGGSVACTFETTGTVWPISGTATPDLPIAATYGPRQLSSRDYAYDYHHGLDLPADEGTPVRAIADGVVFRAGDYPWYDHTIALVRHCPAGWDDTCDEPDALYAFYDHLTSVSVAEGDSVTQGQELGLSGISETGYPHLHFEIRAGGYQESDAVHPMRYLPYDNDTDAALEVDSLSLDGAGGATLSATVSLPASEPDLVSVTAWILVRDGSSMREVSSQTVDLEERNHTYDDASDDLIDEPDLDDVTLEPAIFNSDSSSYALGVTFHGLADGGNPTDSLRVEIDAVDASGRRTDIEADASAL